MSEKNNRLWLLKQSLNRWKVQQAELLDKNCSTNKSNDTNESNSGSLNKTDILPSAMNSCTIDSGELKSSEIFKTDAAGFDIEDDSKPKYLDEILDLAEEEEDLLCKISVQENESSSDSDSDEIHLHYEFSESQQLDPKQMLNDKLCLYEKQKVPALQIGTAIPEPVFKVEGAKFSKTVLKVLKEINFYGPSCIQSVVWPAVERRRDIFVIAPPHSGKTVSYVLPLVSRLTSELEQIKEDGGPHVIVLCSSWRKVEAVNNCFRLFFGNTKKKIFSLYTDGGHYKNKMKFLVNNCDILIATPHCLLEIFKKKMMCFSRLDSFVLDDGSNVMGKHKKELKEIILHIMNSTKKINCCPQLILCSERWNKNFQIIVDKIMSSPVLYFTSFLEAAIYAKIPIIDHVFDSKQTKMAALHDLVNCGARKIVISTIDESDASEVYRFLENSQCQSYLVNGNMEHFVVDDVIESWKLSDSPATCLVATDQILTDMRISNADCLIHFDVPPKSRLQFGNRFSAIAEHFTRKESDRKCVCHILVLESEQQYAANLVEIIENSHRTPSRKLMELRKVQKKDQTISGDLCHYMKAFGVCTRPRCKNRHTIVPAIDKPQIVPCEGDIHGIVTHIVDASHYFVRLIKYLDPTTSKTVSLIGTYAKIGFQLRDLYLSSKDKKVETPIIGESYVIEENNKLFYRVKILGFVPESSTHVAQWRVLFLDEGWIKYCKTLTLYKLRDDIDLPKLLAVEVYACNIAPPDSSFDWNPQTSRLVSDLIKGKEIHGKIVLCIGKTVWLDPLAVTVRLCDGNYVYPFKIDQKLLDCGHVIKRKSHLESLFKACSGKIPLPNITKPKAEEKTDNCEPSINYAFLDCDVFEDVYVSCLISPEQLYIQRAKFVNCLDELLDKINAQVEKRKLKKACSIFKDMVCIAPFFEDDRYYRATVTDLLPEGEVRVFFVDFGDTGIVSRKDIFSISAEFLLLPFQAIECELAGICAPHGGWTESAVSNLTTLTRDESYDMKILQLKAYSKTSSYTSGNHYVIDLWDDEKKLSDKLLQAGFCVLAESSTRMSNNDSAVQCTNAVFNLDEDSSSSEDDMDPDDKDTSAQFYGVVAKMLAEHYDMFPLPKEPSTDDSDDAGLLNRCNISSLPASKVKCDNFEKLHPNLNKIKKFLPKEETSSISYRPLIIWWDKPEELNILINLKDIKIYELNIKDESLIFNTIIAGTQYATEETFYEKINSSDVKTNHTLQGINIVAKKCTPFKWPRLTKEKKKFFHIKYDFHHLEDSDTEEHSHPDKQKSKIQSDMRYAYNDENNSSTDEEETYVEPWKEFAQHKDSINELFKEI